MWRMQVQNLTLRFDGQALFCGLNFEIFERDRVALVGDNASGKSTLMNVLADKLRADEGSIRYTPKKPGIAHLPQERFDLSSSLSVYDYAKAELADIIAVKQKVSQLEQQMAEVGADEDLFEKYVKLRDKFEAKNGYSWQSRLEKALLQMDIDRDMWNKRAESLSGGEKTRLLFARLMAREPDFLLLDEPTNDLDWPTLRWLEGFFEQFDGTIFYVSHDRDFLKRTAGRVFKLCRGDLDVYDCNYEIYRKERRKARERAQQEYEKRAAERKRLKQMLQRQKEWAHKSHEGAGTNDFLRRRAKVMARRAKAIEGRLERDLQKDARKPWEKDGVNLDLKTAGKAKKQVASANDLVIGFGDEIVAEKINFQLSRGDRLAVLGENGSGKTTLLETIKGNIEPLKGRLRINGGLEVFALDQQLADMPFEITPEDWLMKRTGSDRTEVRTALGCLELRGEVGEQPLHQLSRGQRVRVVLAQLVIKGADLICMDEPTNHLDLDSREAIEEALSRYSGTLIFASHDRYFVRAMASRILDLDTDPPSFFYGSWSEYDKGTRTKKDDERLRIRMRRAVESSDDNTG